MELAMQQIDKAPAEGLATYITRLLSDVEAGRTYELRVNGSIASVDAHRAALWFDPDAIEAVTEEGEGAAIIYRWWNFPQVGAEQ